MGCEGVAAPRAAGVTVLGGSDISQIYHKLGSCAGAPKIKPKLQDGPDRCPDVTTCGSLPRSMLLCHGKSQTRPRSTVKGFALCTIACVATHPSMELVGQESSSCSRSYLDYTGTCDSLWNTARWRHTGFIVYYLKFGDDF